MLELEQTAAKSFPSTGRPFQLSGFRHFQQELSSRGIVSSADEADVRVILLLRGDWFDLAVGGRRKKFCRESESSPFRVEAGDEKSLRQFSNGHDVCDFRAVRALVPLRVVVPHRVRLAIDDRRNRIEIETVAFAEEHKIRLEPASVRQRPPLRELAADDAVGALVVDQERLVAISLESTLGALLHPPPLIAADDEDSQVSCGSSAFITSRSFPESRVLGHYARCRQAGEDKSASAIAKSTLQEVHAYEPRRRLEENGAGRATPSLGKVLLRPPPAVPVELLKVLVQRNVRVVEEFTFDFPNLSIRHIDVFVYEVGVVAQLAPEETDWLVVAPASVTYLLAEKEIAARNAIG